MKKPPRTQTLEGLTKRPHPPATATLRQGFEPPRGEEPLPPGTLLARRFRIGQPLGSGGMGQVYEAEDLELGTTLALKRLRPRLADRKDSVEQLRREVRLARQVTHPYVCRIFDLVHDPNPDTGRPENGGGGSPVLALTMERIHGETLGERLRRQGPPPLDIALDWIARMAEALEAAHRVGVMHRDFKSANVLLEGEDETTRVVVTDFGLARALPPEDAPEDPPAGESPEDFFGTPAYMAPEQTAGRPSIESDLYALGVVIYEVLTGRRPFEATSPQRLAHLHRTAPPPSLGELVPALDPHLAKLFESCLAKDPQQRPASAAEVARGVTERQRAAAARTRRELERANRRRRFALLAMVLALGVALAATWVARRIAREATRARDAARIAVAVEQIEKDPTSAALALLEVEEPGPIALAKMRQALNHPIARFEYRLPGAHGLGLDPTGEWVAYCHGNDVHLLRIGEPAPSRILRGHTENTTSIQFSPDGRSLLTTSHDQTARLWPLADDGPVRIFGGHGGRIWTAAFDPHGRRIVIPSEDGNARIWDLEQEGEPLVLSGHRHWVMEARFSPDGERVVTASRDGTVRVWSATEEAEPVVLEGHGSWVFDARFSADGTRVVSASRDATARLWNADGSGQAMVFEGHERSVMTAELNADGTRVLTSSQDGTVRLFEADGSGSRVLFQGPGVGTAQFIAGGRKLLFSASNQVHILPADGRGEALVFQALPLGTRHLQVDDGATRLVTQSWDGTLRLWDLDGPRWSRLLSSPLSPGHLAVDSEGRRIATGRNDGSVWIVALDGGEEARLFSGHRGTIYDLEIHPDGHQVATASRDDTARLWSLEPGGGSVVLRGHEGSVYGLSYHPRGHLLATAAFDGTVGLWRTDPGEGITETGPLAQLPASRHTTDIDFDPTGRLLAVASDEAVIRIWRFDETTLAFDGDPVVLDGGCRHAALPTFTPDGRWLAVSVDSGTVQLWDVERALAGDPDPAKIFDLHEGPISAMAFDSEGRRLITSGWDNLARVVSLEGDRKILDLDQGSLLGSVVFLPQGDQVATASKEGIRIWRLVDDVRGTLRAATEACLPWRVREKHLLEERSEARARFRECERRHGRLP